MPVSTNTQTRTKSNQRAGTDRRRQKVPVAVDRRATVRRSTDASNISTEARSAPEKIAARSNVRKAAGDLLQPSPSATQADSNDDWTRRQDRYSDRARQMDSVVNIKDDALRNYRITQDYSNLSHEMRDMLGPDSGANWATFATWASRQAGETIRQEDLGTTAKLGKRLVDGMGFAGALIPPVGGLQAGSKAYDASSASVARGNRKVYQEIAPHFARFAETFKGDKTPDAKKLERFLKGFKPGSVENGGQDGLRDAFANYHQAMFETDPNRKKELVFVANGQIGAHEQHRLQPEIQGALPYGTRGLATDWMMRLGLPDGRGGVGDVSLGEDVPSFRGRSAPRELEKFWNKDALEMLKKWDKRPTSLEGSGAGDWTNISDRMNFILDLFRSRHDDPALFQQPFNSGARRQIQAGRLPSAS